MSKDLIKIEAFVNQIRYPKGPHEGGYTIATFIQDKASEHYKKLKENYGSLSAKGDMIRLKSGIKYSMLIREGETHPKFGTTYEVVSMSRAFDFRNATPGEIKKFLSTLMTDTQLDAFYSVFNEDPMKPFIDEDTKALQQVDGIGEVYSELIMTRFLETKDFSEVFIRLARYNLDPSTIKDMLKYHGGDPDVLEDSIKENPYKYMLSLKLPFAVCDRMYAVDGGTAESDLRLAAIMTASLLEAAEKGDTWLPPLEVCNPVKMYTNNVPAKRLGEILIEDDLFYVSEDRQRVSLQYYVDMEKRVANKLLTLMENSRPKDMNEYQEKIDKIQEDQGWEFSSQQREAIEEMINSNVFLLEGYGGTGKTTVIKTVLDLMPEEFAAQCALSGKASDNLAKVTGRPGYTIKRLLMTQTDDYGVLPHTIVIVDEFAMVDLELFDELLDAIDDFTKLILVGDCEQLEAIGIPVMKQLIQTNDIPYMMFTEIHRQAQKSAVITDSIKIRNGESFLLEDESSGTFVHGELEDLHLHLMQDEVGIIGRAVNVFAEKIKTETINDIQIIAQTVSNSNEINRKCKEVYNPINFKESQTSIEKITRTDSKGEDIHIYKETYNYVNIRGKDELLVSVGDKVINKKNNYKTNKVGEINYTPIFNGNTGIIREIIEDPDFGMIMHIEFDGVGLIAVPKDFWNSIDLAYCITVHKSQGSSCKVIIAVITSHKYLNTRQLLYTGITRVKEEGHLISTREALLKAIFTYNASYRKNSLTLFYFECKKAMQDKEEIDVIENEELYFG